MINHDVLKYISGSVRWVDCSKDGESSVLGISNYQKMFLALELEEVRGLFFIPRRFT